MDEVAPATAPEVPPGPEPRVVRRGGVKLWQMVLLVAFAAVAIADIQNHRRSEPVLLGLAAGGFAAYALIAWLAWNFAGRFEGRINRVALVAIYLASMAGFFLFATIAYLLIEYVYLGGRPF